MSAKVNPTDKVDNGVIVLDNVKNPPLIPLLKLSVALSNELKEYRKQLRPFSRLLGNFMVLMVLATAILSWATAARNNPFKSPAERGPFLPGLEIAVACFNLFLILIHLLVITAPYVRIGRFGLLFAGNILPVENKLVNKKIAWNADLAVTAQRVKELRQRQVMPSYLGLLRKQTVSFILGYGILLNIVWMAIFVVVVPATIVSLDSTGQPVYDETCTRCQIRKTLYWFEICNFFGAFLVARQVISFLQRIQLVLYRGSHAVLGTLDGIEPETDLDLQRSHCLSSVCCLGADFGMIRGPSAVEKSENSGRSDNGGVYYVDSGYNGGDGGGGGGGDGGGGGGCD